MALKIGIIGVGPIGTLLATRWTQLGHSVKIANSRGPETLTEKEKETGATAVKMEDAVKNVDIVVVSIPFSAVGKLPKTLFSDAPKDLIILDTNNYYPEFRDQHIEQLDNFTITDSEWVSSQLGRPVIKVFNNLGDFSLRESPVPAGTKGRVALPVSGDDVNAKKLVINLLNEYGFDGFDLGTLAESWKQQPGAPIYGTDLTLEQVPAALAVTDRKKNAVVRGLTLPKLFAAFNSSSEVKRRVFRECAYPAILDQ